VLSKCNRERLVHISSSLKAPIQFDQIFIRIQHLEPSLILIQILDWILKSGNRETHSLFNSLQIYNLFEKILSRKSQFWSNQILSV
jgi:hypothetical protein